MYLLATNISSLENVCSEPLPISKRIMWGNFCYCMSCIYFGYCPLPDIWFANTFFPFCRLHFHSIDFFFCASFLVWYSPSCSFFILLLVFQVCFFFNLFCNWRKIALQCCVGFCHTTLQVNHNYTYNTSLLGLQRMYVNIWLLFSFFWLTSLF